MIWIILLLCAIAAVAKAAMDTLNFWHTESLFNKWTDSQRDGWAAFWRDWAGPDSWENKYLLSDNPVISWLLQGPLVFLTDAWHFFQFIFLTCFQLCIGLLAPGPWWLWVIGLKVFMGLTFELAARVWRDEQRILKLRETRARSTRPFDYVLDEIRTPGPSIRWAQIYIASVFFLAVGVGMLLGGDPEAVINAGTVGAIIVAGLGLVGFQILRTKVWR